MAPFTPATKYPPSLPVLDLTRSHTFIRPAKLIHEGHDVPHFLSSRAYTDIGIFLTQLNFAMCPRLVASSASFQAQTWPLDSGAVSIPPPVKKIREMLGVISEMLKEAPPDTGPRRFGNVAFRKWYALLEERVDGFLDAGLEPELLQAGSGGGSGQGGEEVTAREELKAYLLGGFGSAQRLDYGTGHELSFLAFLGAVWKLGGFPRNGEGEGAMERSIVLEIIEPYLRVVRKLILTYTLEPAGSHGVWGLDDHAFLPYIFGSAQYCPAVVDGAAMPIEGSLPHSPNPGDVAKKDVVDRERKRNMYFAAVGFIYDVKTGPFWEHSPILFDISGIRSGWGKINKGMIKMYNAEVLSKFPVVQHFPFGSLFSWDIDPSAPPPAISTQVAGQPSGHTAPAMDGSGGTPESRPHPQEGTKAPWVSQPLSSSAATITTAAPWATGRPPPTSTLPRGIPPTRAPWASAGGPGNDGPTRVSWAKPTGDSEDPEGR